MPLSYNERVSHSILCLSERLPKVQGSDPLQILAKQIPCTLSSLPGAAMHQPEFWKGEMVQTGAVVGAFSKFCTSPPESSHFHIHQTLQL